MKIANAKTFGNDPYATTSGVASSIAEHASSAGHLPTGGANGNYLRKTANGTEWANVEIPNLSATIGEEWGFTKITSANVSSIASEVVGAADKGFETVAIKSGADDVGSRYTANTSNRTFTFIAGSNVTLTNGDYGVTINATGGTSGAVTSAGVSTIASSVASGVVSSVAYTKTQVDSKISAVEDKLTNVYTYKGSVATYSALPASSSVEVGYVYNIESADTSHGVKAGDNVAWNGSAWDMLAGTVDLSGYAQTTTVSGWLDSKVDKVDGKGLSTEDFTTALKTKLTNIESDATKVTSATVDGWGFTKSPEVTSATVSGWGYTKVTSDTVSSWGYTKSPEVTSATVSGWGYTKVSSATVDGWGFTKVDSTTVAGWGYTKSPEVTSTTVDGWGFTKVTSSTVADWGYTKSPEVTSATVAGWGFTKSPEVTSATVDGWGFTKVNSSTVSGWGYTQITSANVSTIASGVASSVAYTKSQVDSKISAVEDKLTNVYTYKGSVSAYSALPSTGLQTGYVYNIESADSTHGIKAGDNVAWNGTSWDPLAGTVDLSAYAQTSTVSGWLDSKVDKVDGKGLSTEDFTTDFKTKLTNIASGAEVNQNAFKTVVAKTGNTSTNVSATGKTDTITLVAGDNISIAGNATSKTVTISATYGTATTASNGLMGSAMVTKLNGIESGAEVNQSAFKTVAVSAGGSTVNVVADSKEDTITLVAGSGIAIEGDATNDKVTFSVPVDATITSNGVKPVAGSAIFSAIEAKADYADMARVAFTGDYNDLANKPDISGGGGGGGAGVSALGSEVTSIVSGTNVTMTNTNGVLTINATDHVVSAGGSAVNVISAGSNVTMNNNNGTLTISATDTVPGSATITLSAGGVSYGSFNVNASTATSANIPQAATNRFGVMKVGSGLAVTNGVVSANISGGGSKFYSITNGNNITLTNTNNVLTIAATDTVPNSGTMTLYAGSSGGNAVTQVGTFGANQSVDSTLVIPNATSASYGVVKIGSGISVTDGVISVDNAGGNSADFSVLAQVAFTGDYNDLSNKPVGDTVVTTSSAASLSLTTTDEVVEWAPVGDCTLASVATPASGLVRSWELRLALADNATLTLGTGIAYAIDAEGTQDAVTGGAINILLVRATHTGTTVYVCGTEEVSA